MSTGGLASEDEIDEAVTTAREAGCNDLVLLHCISSYPAPMDQANLRQIPELSKRVDALAGLSDHTMGAIASASAIALSTCLIEKHFTLIRAGDGPTVNSRLSPMSSSACVLTRAMPSWPQVPRALSANKPMPRANIPRVLVLLERFA